MLGHMNLGRTLWWQEHVEEEAASLVVNRKQSKVSIGKGQGKIQTPGTCPQ
jgi:hypothetical protein